jgi:hypothetical protein
MTAQLEPCICGHRAHWRTGNHGGFLIKCDYCDASTGGSCTSLERAVDGWNKSVELSRLREVEKDSTDLHKIVVEQHKKIAKLKYLVEEFINVTDCMCNVAIDYECVKCEAKRILKENADG